MSIGNAAPEQTPRHRVDPSTRPTRRRRRARDRRHRLLLTAAAMIGAGSLVAGTWATWTAADSNANNTFTSSTVLIADNQGGQAGSANSTGTTMFNVTDLSPGSAATTRCIGVDFNGNATGLTLSATLGGSGQSTLQSELTMDVATYNSTGSTNVTPGSNTNSGSCSNYPATGTNTTAGSQGASLQSWADGGPYTIASPVTHTWYKFTVSGLPPGDTNCATYCNKTITVTLTWTITAT